MLALKWFRATPAGDYSLEIIVEEGYHFALKNNFLMLGLSSAFFLGTFF